MSACLGHAVRDGRLPFNPAIGVEKRREIVARPRVLSPLELEKIRRQMPSHRDAVLVSLMSLGGLRPAEAFGLTWGSVGNLLVIDRSFVYGEWRSTKTGSRRTIDIVEPLREDLEAFRPESAAPSDLVAPNRQGRPLDLRTWRRRIWRPAVERAGVEASPYDLRHAYCSLLAHEGRSAPYIAAMMGHSLTDTQRHYAHLIDDSRLAAGTTMVAAVREARAKVKVRPRYAQPRQRHLQAVAESA